MRFYNIQITNPTNGKAILPSSLGGLPLSSLLPNGGPNPAALNIELDIPVAPYASPAGQAFVRVWGLGLQDIGSAANLNGMNIKVFGGMSAGLPLANPAEQGLLVQGQIFQAFGNWVGTDQTIDLILTPSTGTQDAPSNLVLNWKAGTPLSQALASTLTTAFPGVQQNIKINANLVLQHDEVGYYSGLTQLAGVVKDLSQAINPTGNYPGVDIAFNGSVINVSDSTSPPAAKAISFQDMVGQPTWFQPNVITLKLVLRGDLDLLQVIKIPPSLATSTQEALLRFQDKSTFSGNYVITDLHHFGNFRQPDAASWNTTVQATPQPAT